VSGGHALLETSSDEWDAFMDTNGKGAFLTMQASRRYVIRHRYDTACPRPFLTTQAAVRQFRSQAPRADGIRGRIVNISSQV